MQIEQKAPALMIQAGLQPPVPMRAPVRADWQDIIRGEAQPAAQAAAVPMQLEHKVPGRRRVILREVDNGLVVRQAPAQLPPMEHFLQAAWHEVVNREAQPAPAAAAVPMQIEQKAPAPVLPINAMREAVRGQVHQMAADGNPVAQQFLAARADLPPVQGQQAYPPALLAQVVAAAAVEVQRMAAAVAPAAAAQPQQQQQQVPAPPMQGPAAFPPWLWDNADRARNDNAAAAEEAAEYEAAEQALADRGWIGDFNGRPL